MSDRTLGLHVRARSGPGILHQLSGAIARHRGDITSVEIVERAAQESRVYFEVELPGPPDALVADLRGLDAVLSLDVVETFQRVYGKRIIIMGGGAQVGQVAIGAISEADRHNIRGEHISVDTIPLVGEKPLAEAVRAVVRLPRAKALVLAGSLMGGEIEEAVREVRAQGPARDQPQHGGERPRRGRPRRHRPRAGRGHGGDGGRGHGEVHGREAEAPGRSDPEPGPGRVADRGHRRVLEAPLRRDRVDAGPHGLGASHDLDAGGRGASPSRPSWA